MSKRTDYDFRDLAMMLMAITIVALVSCFLVPLVCDKDRIIEDGKIMQQADPQVQDSMERLTEQDTTGNMHYTVNPGGIVD